MRGFTRIIEVIQNIYFDLKYGKILCGVKKTPYRHLGAHDTANTRYSVVWIKMCLKKMMRKKINKLFSLRCFYC